MSDATERLRNQPPAPSDVLAWRAADDEALLQHCRWEAFRGSGPGGQKRNKTSSAVRITHEPSGLSAIASESRSQHDNRRAALRRLRHRMALSLRVPLDLPTFAPPPWFTALRDGGQVRCSPRNEHYLPAAGLVLDVLEAVGAAVADAAAMLGLSTAGLVRFLAADEKLWAHANELRARNQLKPLRARE